MGEGTVGSMIARVLGVSDLLNYTDDGTVKNAAMLSGVTANGYLKRSDICPSGQYWTGIDTDGKSTCGSTTILLADMGTITDVGNGMTIYRADGTTINPVNIPTVVKSGDIIKTDGTGTGTITFSDLSVLRIDTDTTVSMDQTTSGTGVTIASALLANGSIWGRILTSTGVYNIGSSDIVAAVRGTSIVVTQTGATTSVAKDASGKYTITKTGSQGKTQLAILDSALGTGSITTVNCTRTIRKDVIEE